MPLTEITDPKLLEELETEVTDPDILAQLNEPELPTPMESLNAWICR